MKTLTKLALISAMAVSGSAFAMESMDDSALSATTGQDGITIKVIGDITADNVVVHDKDGLTLAGHGISAAGAGAIVLGKDSVGGGVGFSIADTGTTKKGITLKVDADGNGGAPVLNVNVTLPDQLTIHTGDISVASSTRATSSVGATDLGQFDDEVKILDDLTIVLGQAGGGGTPTTMNIQLGNSPQGAMIVMDGTISGGLDITGLSLLDKNTYTGLPTSVTQLTADRGVHIGTIHLASAGVADLNLSTKIGFVDGGMLISGNSNMDVGLMNLKLGSKANTASLGDVAIKNMSVPNLLIMGH